MSRELPVDVVVEEVVSAGLQAVVGHGRKHRKVRFHHAGRRWTYVCAATPSDPRTILNTRAGIRRLL